VKANRPGLIQWRRNPFNNELLTAVEAALGMKDKQAAAERIIAAVLERERAMAAVKRGPMGMRPNSRRYPDPHVKIGGTKFMIPRSTIGLGQKVMGVLERISKG